jgi:hypothetical protein
MNPAGNRRRGTSCPSSAKEILVAFGRDVFWLTAFPSRGLLPFGMAFRASYPFTAARPRPISTDFRCLPEQKASKIAEFLKKARNF